ncbi:MAG: cyclodeaminase/cyclohydrolase family protein [Desulfobacterales bacterium]
MLSNLCVKEFLEKTASSSPFPGGGSVAALGAALGAALTEMVANLTIGKKGYESADGEMRGIRAKAAELREKMTQYIDRDSASYEEVMKSFGLPKDTQEQKARRTESIQNALKNAALVPLEVAEMGLDAMDLTEKALRFGNKNAATDGVVGMLMLRSAVMGALRNVKINLESIQDSAFCKKLSARVNELEDQVIAKERVLFLFCM